MPSAVLSTDEISPNRGTTIDASRAVPNQQTVEEWRKLAGIDGSNQVQLVKLSHMRYQHVDIDKITIFLKGKFTHWKTPRR